MQRRDFLNLSAAGGGAVFLSALAGCANTPANTTAGASDFYFVQLSDVHWGFQGPPNPDAKGTLHKAIAAVNALESTVTFTASADCEPATMPSCSALRQASSLSPENLPSQ